MTSREQEDWKLVVAMYQTPSMELNKVQMVVLEVLEEEVEVEEVERMKLEVLEETGLQVVEQVDVSKMMEIVEKEQEEMELVH